MTFFIYSFIIYMSDPEDNLSPGQHLIEIEGQKIIILGVFRNAPPFRYQRDDEVEKLRIFLLVKLETPYTTLMGEQEHWMPMYVSSGSPGGSGTGLEGEVNLACGALMHFGEMENRVVISENNRVMMQGETRGYIIPDEAKSKKKLRKMTCVKDCYVGAIPHSRFRKTFNRIQSEMLPLGARALQNNVRGSRIVLKMLNVKEEDLEVEPWVGKCAFFTEPFGPLSRHTTPTIAANVIATELIQRGHSVDVIRRNKEELLFRLDNLRKRFGEWNDAQMMERAIKDVRRGHGRQYAAERLEQLKEIKRAARVKGLDHRQGNLEFFLICGKIKQKGWRYDMLDAYTSYANHRITITFNDEHSEAFVCKMFDSMREINEDIGEHNPFGINLSHHGLIRPNRKSEILDFYQEYQETLGMEKTVHPAYSKSAGVGAVEGKIVHSSMRHPASVPTVHTQSTDYREMGWEASLQFDAFVEDELLLPATVLPTIDEIFYRLFEISTEEQDMLAERRFRTNYAQFDAIDHIRKWRVQYAKERQKAAGFRDRKKSKIARMRRRQQQAAAAAAAAAAAPATAAAAAAAPATAATPATAAAAAAGGGGRAQLTAAEAYRRRRDVLARLAQSKSLPDHDDNANTTGNEGDNQGGGRRRRRKTKRRRIRSKRYKRSRRKTRRNKRRKNKRRRKTRR